MGDAKWVMLQQCRRLVDEGPGPADVAAIIIIRSGQCKDRLDIPKSRQLYDSYWNRNCHGRGLVHLHLQREVVSTNYEIPSLHIRACGGGGGGTARLTPATWFLKHRPNNYEENFLLVGHYLGYSCRSDVSRRIHRN